MYPADTGACGNIRMRWPAHAAREAGYDVTVFDPGPMDSLPVQVGIDPVTRQLTARATAEVECDVVVFQRPLNWRIQFAIPLLQKLGVRTVVDIDDDLGALHRKHEAYHRLHPSLNDEGNWRNLAASCAAADAVVVTTPALAKRYGQHRAIVVENCIPRGYLDVEVERDPERLIIGWTGRVGTHPGDLDVLRGSLQPVLNQTGATFRILGGSGGARDAGSLKDEPELVEGVALSEYPREVARFDIGIAPLDDTSFNRAKSWLKPLDYAACGVPFVCSDTDEYRRFTAQGCGLVARRPREWGSALKRLAGDATMRADLAAAGREVAARWVVDDHVDDFVEAWAGVIPAREDAP